MSTPTISDDPPPTPPPERRPLLKKSRTTTTPHFPPTPSSLRPPSSSSSSSWSPRRSFDSSDSSTTTTSDTFPGQTFGFGDRDYVYPSFLGPNTTRNRVTVVKTSNMKSLRKQAPVMTPGKASGVVPLGGHEGRSREPDVKMERGVKNVSGEQVSVSASSMSSGSAVRKSGRVKVRSSLMFNLLIVSCLVFASYAISLRSEVTKLQEKNSILLRIQSKKDTSNYESIDILEDVNEDSFWKFGNTDSRAIALYIVLFTLITPFVLYKYLDDLPKIKNISKRDKHNKEEVPLKKRIAYMVDLCMLSVTVA